MTYDALTIGSHKPTKLGQIKPASTVLANGARTGGIRAAGSNHCSSARASMVGTNRDADREIRVKPRYYCGDRPRRGDLSGASKAFECAAARLAVPAGQAACDIPRKSAGAASRLRRGVGRQSRTNGAWQWPRQLREIASDWDRFSQRSLGILPGLAKALAQAGSAEFLVDLGVIFRFQRASSRWRRASVSGECAGIMATRDRLQRRLGRGRSRPAQLNASGTASS